MIMFQGGNFAVLEENANRTDILAYHQQLTPVNSPADSNLSEDQISIKSVNQFTLESNGFEESSYQNFERTYEEVDSGYADGQLADQYGSQTESSQAQNCNEMGSCYDSYETYDAFGFGGTSCEPDGYGNNSCSEPSQSTNLPEVKQKDFDQFAHDHFDLERIVNQQLFDQPPVDQHPPTQHPTINPQSPVAEKRNISTKQKPPKPPLLKPPTSSFDTTTKFATSSKSTAIDQTFSPEPKRSNQLETKKRIPRPANAFMIFGQRNRKILANKFPQCTNKQISKMLGDEWRGMNKEEKSHFHALADEAHKEHLQKYPGYYYSPLEARLAKADRKKKHNEKMNSKRGYGKQPSSSSSSSPATNQTNGEAKCPVQPSSSSAAFSSSTTFGGVLDKRTNESNNSPMKLPEMKLPETAVYPNSRPSSNFPAICAPSVANSQSFNCQRAIVQPNALQQHHSICYHHNASHHHNQLKQNSKFDPNRYAPIRPDIQSSGHSIQPGRNVLFCSQTVQNNVVQLFNMPNENDLMDNRRFFNQPNNFSNNNCHPFNGTPLYHHHSSSGYPAPTVFHVTSKDPNLNSTLSTADGAFANIQLPNSMPNGHSNMNPMNSTNHQSCSNLILANQFMQQHQQHHQQQQQQLAQKTYNLTETGSSFPLFLPQIEPENSSNYSTSHLKLA